jgi:hypothetical protein
VKRGRFLLFSGYPSSAVRFSLLLTDHPDLFFIEGCPEQVFWKVSKGFSAVSCVFSYNQHPVPGCISGKIIEINQY